MRFVEHHQVIEAFAPNRAEEALDVAVLPYMDPARLQEPLLFFEIPVAAIYSTSLNGRMFCYYRPSHDVSRAPGALHGGDLFLINRAMAEHSFARCRSDRMSSI